MTKKYATIICSWKYDHPYSMYSMDSSDESIQELMEETYYYALDKENVLIGYICIGNTARVPGGYVADIYTNNEQIDIGLGLSPDRTGRGNGLAFLTHAIRFLDTNLKIRHLQLVVAAFNERAIKVYERVGFRKNVYFMSKVDDQEIQFVSMNLALEI
ncbi:GNAT family N-acetyltransferase [Paenibacillus sp. GSMTC-2017]|uniref:GNAT family N-acetyltransferase n=1 Tax=Paenibacillus sp. GSMTC-2017 TaxID=2794350 RepID=UPI001E31F27A|nr:GNAT family protein [Paenibacillus sp. GSMTC-2017]